jgi:peptide/nickel transport system ATP-binding protein
MTDYLIEARNLTRQFGVHRRLVTAVDNISLGIYPGEVVCLVGESGCGKTTTGKLFTGLLKPSSGQILYRGKDIWKQDAKGFKEFRLGVQIIHQDPYASLNPSHTIYTIISTPLLRHRLVEDAEQAHDKARRLLRIVDLTPEDEFLSKYPHQLSGGQRQRVSVARSLTVNPKVIIADEAVSMVDVSIRVGLLNMLSRLKREMGVTFLFITHDLAVAKFFGWEGRVAVMYVGSMVEIAATPQLINEPLHPYSMALLAAVPEANPEITRHKERVPLRSQDVPNLLNLPSGCLFHPRCPMFEKGLCDVQTPLLTEVKPSHFVACHVAVRKAREQAE